MTVNLATQLITILKDNGLYGSVLSMNDADLEELAKALTGALTVARNAICLREVAK